MRLANRAAGLFLAALLLPAPLLGGEKTEGTCGSHGTAIDFVATPGKAATLAKKEQKLVFVLHVSGHFEKSEFT